MKLAGRLATAGAALLALLASVAGAESVSRGTPARGSLEAGESLPASGPGFTTYSRLGNAIGRQYVHSRVRATLLDAFAELHTAKPDRIFVVGETGFRRGGRFRPHRTHQNGLSVDVFMPVLDAEGSPASLPTPPWRRFGYALEFDADGRGEGLSIDFAALAELLVVLQRAAVRHGLDVARIIIAPEYIDRVLAAGGSRLALLADRFTRTPAWVRHDEHLHLDFRLQPP